MVSWLILLSAVFGSVFCDSPEIRVVQNLIDISNEHFREINKTEIPLPDIGWIFEPIRYREGRLGQFDTLALLPHSRVTKRTNHYGTVYNFDLNTALENLTVKYKFFVNYPLFGRHGNVTITVNEKSFKLEGRVLVKKDGSCFAFLDYANLVKFGDFQVKYDPDDVPFFTKIYESVLNFVHQQMSTLINLAIRNEISKSTFRKHFDKYVCDEVTRNSTTEEPTTYIPTTFQPEPTTSSSVPVHSTTSVPDYSTTGLPDYSTTSVPDYSTTSVPDYSTTSVPEYSTTSVPEYSTTSVPEYSTTSVPDYSTTSVPDYSTTSVPEYSTTSVPEYSTTSVPEYSTTSVPEYSTTSVPEYSTTSVPEYSTTSVPEYSTTSVPYQ